MKTKPPRRSFLICAGLCLLTIPGANAAHGELDGLKGAELKEAVAVHYRPLSPVESLSNPGGVWEAFRLTDCDGDGQVIDRFSESTHRFPSDGYSAPAAMEITAVTPPQWWGLTLNDPTGAARDLHNLLPAPAGTSTIKKSYPPGIVGDAVHDNGIWKAGSCMVEGVEINCYQPPRGMEGDFARAVMYVISVYPCDFWKNLGENFLADNSYPTLQPWARRLLMAWHHADPPDERERRRNNAVAAIQGNLNPFVELPSLADHIWGEKSGEPFSPPDEPEPAAMPLRGIYSLEDPRIDLVSPYVPDDAEWSVDGKPTTEKHLIPSNLGKGVHELRFSATGATGKIKIEIR